MTRGRAGAVTTLKVPDRSPLVEGYFQRVTDSPRATVDMVARAGLILTATGIVSAATVRYAVDEGGNIVLGFGYFLYLVLIAIAIPRRQLRIAPVVAFAAFAAMFLTATAGDVTNDLGLSLYVVAAAAAYVATPRVFRPLTVAAFALWSPAFPLFGASLGERYPIWIAVASLLALFFLVAVLVARRPPEPDEHLRRIGLGLLAVATTALISERHLVVASLGIAPDDLWAGVVVVGLPIIAVARIRRSLRDALATGIALGGYFLVGLVLLLGKSYHVDSVVVVHRAAQLLLAGRDPYLELNVAEALARFGVDPRLGTHLENGAQLMSFNYPALSFLVPAPFVALGVTDIRFVYLAEVVILALILIRAVRLPWRPLVTAAFVGNAVIVRQNILAGVDPLWALLTLGAFLAIGRRWWSPILLGLAAATRQPAWFFGPFYLVAVWRRDGRNEALRRTGIAVLAGLVPNLPFLLWAPGAFVDGVLAPMFGALEPYGVGLIRFSIDGVLPLFNRGAYGVASALSLIVLVAVLWRYWRRIPNAALVFPTLVLWFAWRSLQNYFSFAGVFALSGDDGLIEGGSPPSIAGDAGSQEPRP